MRHGLFTIGAIDNIDVNPSSSTAMSSFHGTAASLHQKVATNANQIEELEKLTLSTDKFLKQLPDEYTEIPPLFKYHRLHPIPTFLRIQRKNHIRYLSVRKRLDEKCQRVIK